MPEVTAHSWSLDGMSIQDVLAAMGENGLNSIPWAVLEKRNEEPEAWNQELHRLYQKQPHSLRVAELRQMIDERWTTPNSLKRSRRFPTELYRGRRQADYSNHGPLNIDHTKVWQQGGKLTCVTTEPYHLEREALEKVATLCVEHGLAAYIHYAAETHNPAHCFAIVALKAGNEAKLPTLAASIAARKLAGYQVQA